MEFAIIRANAKEDREATMTIFMNDLNHDIAHVVGAASSCEVRGDDVYNNHKGGETT
jgi:hypothetical protein